MHTFEHQGLKCPACNYPLELSTALQGDKGPTWGDFSICINCADVLRYSRDMSLYKCPDHELRTLDRDTLHNLMVARLAVVMTLKKREMKR